MDASGKPHNLGYQPPAEQENGKTSQSVLMFCRKENSHTLAGNRTLDKQAVIGKVFLPPNLVKLKWSCPLKCTKTVVLTLFCP